jgi:hypothetical protein
VGFRVTVVAAVLLSGGTALAVISLVVVHLLPTGLNPLRDPVSHYGITPFRGWYWSAAGGAAIAGLGGALSFTQTLSTVSVVTVVLLLVFAVARAAIGFFPMDAPGAAPSGTGRTHNLLATAAFATVTAAAFTGAGALHDAGRSAESWQSTVCGMIMAVGTLGMLLTARSNRITLFGLAERLIYLGFLTWFTILGATSLP